MTNIDPNREAFEKWATGRLALERLADGYKNNRTAVAWNAYNAALVHAASELVALRAQNEIYKSYLSGMASDPFKQPEQYWQYANEALTNAKQLGNASGSKVNATHQYDCPILSGESYCTCLAEISKKIVITEARNEHQG